MIRRGFWLAVGAAGGIMGYRRVTALGRQLSTTLAPTTAAKTADRSDAGQAGTAGGALAAQAGKAGAVLTARASRGLLRGTIRFSRDARMFSRDVREGMDLYMVRHRPQVSPTLGAGARSRRSPAPPPVIGAPGAGAPGAGALRAGAPGATTANDERVKDDR